MYWEAYKESCFLGECKHKAGKALTLDTAWWKK